MQETKVHILKTQWLLFKNYCYIVEDMNSKQAILVDPAWEFETIDNVLNQSNLAPTAVLLTHHHPDHVHLAERCATIYKIPVYMSAAEINYYRFSCKNLQALPDTKQFSIGSLVVRLLSTPGHTFGGMCYLIDNNLFTGDTLFNEGCGICTGKGADPERMFASLQAIKNTVYDNTMIYPGHQFHSPIGQLFQRVKEFNIYLQLDSVTAFVNFRMRKKFSGNWFNFK